MSAVILNFPRHHEIKKLITQNKLLGMNFTSQRLDELESAISCIRKTHGKFNPEHFEIVLKYIEHDWLPSDIPVLLPRPSALEGLN